MRQGKAKDESGSRRWRRDPRRRGWRLNFRQGDRQPGSAAGAPVKTGEIQAAPGNEVERRCAARARDRLRQFIVGLVERGDRREQGFELLRFGGGRRRSTIDVAP
jgi:hypothetical protein